MALSLLVACYNSSGLSTHASGASLNFVRVYVRLVIGDYSCIAL